MTRSLVTCLLSSWLALGLALSPAAAQGKGKGHGGEGKDRKENQKSARADVKDVQKAARADVKDVPKAARADVKDVQKAERADDKGERKSARSDQKIERRFEKEFAGDVALLREKRGRAMFLRPVTLNDLRPGVRRFVVANRLPERVAAGAVARAHLRGLDDDAFVIVPANDRVRIVNREGLVLLDLDDDGARSLGRWDVVALDDRVRDDAPAFCRSGAGHPVWGRQWCLDKGFGLGSSDDVRWARSVRLDDVVFLQPVTTGSLTRDALLSLIGPVAYDRLALHAITLGLAEPIMGRWLGEPGGSRVLYLTSGDRPVAELVDGNGDSRADALVVALRNW